MGPFKQVLFRYMGGILHLLDLLPAPQACSLDAVFESAHRIIGFRIGLLNEDGRARGGVIKVYPLLSEEEVKSLLPDINRSVVEPSPSGIMFSDESRMEGLKMLADRRIGAGIDACMYWLVNQNHWASEKRTPQLLEFLRSYGVHAKRTIPALEKLAADFDAGIPHYFPKNLSKNKAEYVRETIKYLKETTDSPELVEME